MFGFMNQLHIIITFLVFWLLSLLLRYVYFHFGHLPLGKSHLLSISFSNYNAIKTQVTKFPFYSFRQGVYYLSLAAAGFLVFILGLAVLRLVVFCLVWGLTFGSRHLWLLPNLTEDVGFLASFWPLYKVKH